MTEATYHVKNISINGVPRRVIGKPQVSLLTVIRDQLKMTGTKRGCDHGQCGVCNVIMDGSSPFPSRSEERSRACPDHDHRRHQ